MRITNSMISNNSQIHIGNAKAQLFRSQDQYTTQKKIQRPSDDPTIAIRALQLRTRYSQITQYADKNINDAIEWLEDSENKLREIDNILGTYMTPLMNQGASDTLDTKSRNYIVNTLKGYVDGVFSDNANGTFSDRYVFTGYRTDTSLLFMEDTKNLQYKITEQFNSTDIATVKVVVGDTKESLTIDYDSGEIPKEEKVYRIALAYDNCSEKKVDGNMAPPDNSPMMSKPITIALKDKQGNPIKDSSDDDIVYTPDPMKSTDENAYTPSDGIHYLYDTGELIVSAAVYQEIQANDAGLDVTYAKTDFKKGDIRPEMYFECASYNTDSKREIAYANPKDQDIRYEINFNQVEQVNVQARDAIDTDIYRIVDYIEKAVNAVNEVENQISDVEKQISNSTGTTADLEKLKVKLEQEKSLRTGVMQEAFSKGITVISGAQSKVNVAIAALGARDSRMQMTKNRLADEKIDTEKAMSENEDIDIADAYINLTQADNLYQASLSATAKILGNSLLNYI